VKILIRRTSSVGNLEIVTIIPVVPTKFNSGKVVLEYYKKKSGQKLTGLFIFLVFSINHPIVLQSNSFG
jgi:hypothetical protein